MSDKQYKVIVQNKKAFHNYIIVEKLEVGIVLVGNEVKSIRQGKVQIRDSFARVINEELWLFNCHIPVYEQAHKIVKIDPVRNRKLLLHKKQLKKWDVKYHKLLMCKPSYDLYIDDKALNFKKNWQVVLKKKLL